MHQVIAIKPEEVEGKKFTLGALMRWTSITTTKAMSPSVSRQTVNRERWPKIMRKYCLSRYGHVDMTPTVLPKTARQKRRKSFHSTFSLYFLPFCFFYSRKLLTLT